MKNKDKTISLRLNDKLYNIVNTNSNNLHMRNGDMRMSRDREYWTDKEKEILGREYKNGTGLNEIALILNRSESTVHQKIEQLGLRVRNPFSILRESRLAFRCVKN